MAQKKTKQQPKQPSQSQISPTVILVIFVAILAVVLVVAIIGLGNLGQQAQATPSGSDYLTGVETFETPDGLPGLGSMDAPVTVIVYEDFGCSNCRDFALEVEPQFINAYVKTGQVQLISYPVAFVNTLSAPGGEAALCAAEQDAFWEYRDQLFHAQGVMAFNRENLVNFARNTGLDVSSFSNCFDQAQQRATLDNRTQRAVEIGVQGTPSFFINGQFVEGALSYSTGDSANPGIVEIVEQALGNGN